MTLSNKKLIASYGLVVLSGCANITLPVMPIPAPPIVVKESISQICKSTDENQVRANQQYSGKSITLTADVVSVNEQFKPRYSIYMTTGKKVHIHAGTDNQSFAMKLTNGKQATVTGIIENLNYDYSGCSISLKDSKF